MHDLQSRAAAYHGSSHAVVAVAVAGCLLWPTPGLAADMEFTCDNIVGVILAAPDWNAEEDRYANQSVVLTSQPGKGVGRATWSNGNTFPGIAMEMSGGFAIVTVGAEWTEVYHVNVGSLTLLYTKTRGGSQILPNSAVAFHGRCRPGAE